MDMQVVDGGECDGNGAAIVLISHQLSLVKSVAHRVIQLEAVNI